MTKELILKQIIDYYLNSDDFNGLPIYEMDEYYPDQLIELINDEMIEVLSEQEILNPHIKGFDLSKLPKETQIQRVLEKGNHTCFYPTQNALIDVLPNYQKPYRALLEKGTHQFQLIFFNIEILQIYINNPKYCFADFGYSGYIDLKPEYCQDESLYAEYIKRYGMAYERDNPKINRAVAVFVRDLSRLSSNTQMRWKSYELPNQNEYVVEAGFYKNEILGEFVDKYWIMDAILDEMCVINELCAAIGLPNLFRHTYGSHYTDRPDGYSTLLLPTQRNYYDFVLVLEKLLVHNINIKTFLVDCGVIKAVERKDDDGKDKGSLVLLKEWLQKNVRANYDMEQDIMNPLKDIRKIRQVPAHELFNNAFSTDLYEKQKELVEKLYETIYALRKLFMGHPATKDVEIPEHLLDRKNIVFY